MLPTYVTTWRILKNNMLNERSLTQECIYLIIPFIGNSRTGKLIYGGKKSKQWLPLGSGGWDMIGKRHEGTSGNNGHVPHWDIGLTDRYMHLSRLSKCRPDLWILFYIWILPQNCIQISNSSYWYAYTDIFWRKWTEVCNLTLKCTKERWTDGRTEE